jgi:hypothetical protein
MVRRSGGEAGMTAHTSVPAVICGPMFGTPRAATRRPGITARPQGQIWEETDNLLLKLQQRFVNQSLHHRQKFSRLGSVLLSRGSLAETR